MLAGLPYDSSVEDLCNARTRAKLLCRKFNDLMPDETEKRVETIKELFGKTGERVWVEQPFWCDYGEFIEVGNNFFSNHNLVILDCAYVRIGENVFIGPNVGIYAAAHPIAAEQRNVFGTEFSKEITIGDNVWIGGGVTVCPGVSIGDNAVIGAGSVVTKDIPANVVAAGVPCRVIREITLDDFMPEEEYNVF